MSVARRARCLQSDGHLALDLDRRASVRPGGEPGRTAVLWSGHSAGRDSGFRPAFRGRAPRRARRVHAARAVLNAPDKRGGPSSMRSAPTGGQVMVEAFHMGGWGMFPTSFFGLLMIAAAI